MRTYFIVQRMPGNAFTTFTDRVGQQHRVPIGDYRIGPFPSVTAAADHLSEHSLPHSSYTIECDVDASK